MIAVPTTGKAVAKTTAKATGRTGGWRRHPERGLSSVEVVVLAPLIIAFILVLVAFGQQVSGRAAVNGAARDAARAGSLERSTEAADHAARRVATSQLGDICVGGTVHVRRTSSYGHERGTLYTVAVSCEVRGLQMLGVPVAATLRGTSSSPIDRYRRSG